MVWRMHGTTTSSGSSSHTPPKNVIDVMDVSDAGTSAAQRPLFSFFAFPGQSGPDASGTSAAATLSCCVATTRRAGRGVSCQKTDAIAPLGKKRLSHPRLAPQNAFFPVVPYRLLALTEIFNIRSAIYPVLRKPSRASLKEGFAAVDQVRRFRAKAGGIRVSGAGPVAARTGMSASACLLRAGRIAYSSYGGVVRWAAVALATGATGGGLPEGGSPRPRFSARCGAVSCRP